MEAESKSLHAFILQHALHWDIKSNGIGLKEQQIWRKLATDFQSPWVSEVAKRSCSEGAITQSGQESREMLWEGSGSKRGRLGLAQELRDMLRGGEGLGGESCQQPREAGARQLDGCDKWAASVDHTERKRKRSSGGSRGSQLLRQLQAATPAHVQQSSQHKGTSELISGCWKENESSRKAVLHVGPDGVFTAIAIQPWGLPVSHTVCERTAGWQTRWCVASWGYRCTPYISPALSVHLKILLKIIYAPCPNHCPWSAVWFIPCAKKFLSAPLTPALCWRVCLLALVVVAGSRSLVSLSLSFPLRTACTAARPPFNLLSSVIQTWISSAVPG